jgi:hypothetical protein
MRIVAEPWAGAHRRRSDSQRRLDMVDEDGPRGAARHRKAARPGLPPFLPLRARQRAMARRCSLIPILPTPQPARYATIAQNGSYRCAPGSSSVSLSRDCDRTSLRAERESRSPERAGSGCAVCSRKDGFARGNLLETPPRPAHGHWPPISTDWRSAGLRLETT